MTTGWKILTHDLRPPMQGGDPVWDGTPGATLPDVPLDRSDDVCGAGWNFTTDPAAALRIAGVWPTGYPTRLLVVTALGDVVERGDKCRTDRLRIDREATDAELRTAWDALHAPVEAHAAGVTESAWEWRTALGRPDRDEEAVESGLGGALTARRLDDWTLRRYDTARNARDAWAAWAAWDAGAARAARAAWAVWDVWAAWAARDVWDVWAARAARNAWDAWDALTVETAARAGWTDHDPMLLTTGIRDAYRHSLAVAVPVGGTTLGWAMEMTDHIEVEHRG